MHMKAFRAYFDFDDVLSEVENAEARIMMSFDEPTGISTTPYPSSQGGDREGVYYSVDGRKLKGKPAQRGLYIRNGKVVVMK